jgi:hypothetical protein
MSKTWIIEVSVFHNNMFPALTAMGPANAVPTSMLGNHLQSNAAPTFQGLPSPGECIHEQSSDSEINQCLGGQPQSRPRESGDSGVNLPPGGVKQTRVTVEEIEDEDAPGGDCHTESFPGEVVEPLRRPSQYLRRRCPLCFGGSKHDQNQKDRLVTLDVSQHLL